MTVIKIAIENDLHPPYGYYHILAIDSDGSWRPLAHIDFTILDNALENIASIISMEFGVEVEDRRSAAGKVIPAIPL